MKTSPSFPAADPFPPARLRFQSAPCSASWEAEHRRLGREGETIFLPQKPPKTPPRLAPALLPAPRLPLPHGKSSSSGSRCDNSLIFLSSREAVRWIHQERGEQKEAGGEQEAGGSSGEAGYACTEGSLCVGIKEVQILQETGLEARLACVYRGGLSELRRSRGESPGEPARAGGAQGPGEPPALPPLPRLRPATGFNLDQPRSAVGLGSGSKLGVGSAPTR